MAILDLPRPEPHPLRELLKQNGITQAQVALLLGLSVSSVAQILAGYRPPTARQKKVLDELLKTLTEQ
jgi:transcriptional regulator with XRE-family HTH domain